jgi:hypothetical protein
LARLRREAKALAGEIDAIDHTAVFGGLVGSGDLRVAPVHRWFTYKEGFSPQLLGAVIETLALSGGLHVVDVFGGVATTALAGLVHPEVKEVRSVEYSPFARFAGQTKLQWPDLDAARLRRLIRHALSYDSAKSVNLPTLSTLRNPEIFSPQRLHALLRARDHLAELPSCDQPERDFLLLGLAAVIEDLSGAIKDGRALRIKRNRRRRPSSFARTVPETPVSGAVKRALAGQWTAMLGDIEALTTSADLTQGKQSFHISGDARHLKTATLDDGAPALPGEWADLSLFSPPYLNCIDYTEVYKLELWLTGLITSHEEFRETRRGTLRSHPSVRFSERHYFEGCQSPVVAAIGHVASWLQGQGARPELGQVVRQYFEDMLQVWREQRRIVREGGCAVCVVANSTFSRREREDGNPPRELWRVPLLTDVFLAHLAREAGFKSVEIWTARELRPRNVRDGRARESLVVAR